MGRTGWTAWTAARCGMMIRGILIRRLIRVSTAVGGATAERGATAATAGTEATAERLSAARYTSARIAPRQYDSLRSKTASLTRASALPAALAATAGTG